MTFDKKEYMKEYMKIYRAKSKEIIPLWTTNNYKLSEKTIKQYVDIIMRIARKLLPFTPRDLEDSLKNIFNGNKKQSDYDSINQKFKHFINKNFIKKNRRDVSEQSKSESKYDTICENFINVTSKEI